MGITAGMLAGAPLGISRRARNKGTAVAGGGSFCGGEGAGGGGAGAAVGAASGAAAAAGELSCAADGVVASAGGSRGGSTRRDGASIASSKGEASTVACLSEGNAASGVCHLKASSRPVTGDTGRQRSET